MSETMSQHQLDQYRFLAEELKEEKRSTMRMVAKFLDGLQAFEVDPGMVSRLEAWAMSWDIDPEEWRGFRAAHPPGTPIDRGAQVLDLFSQLRAVLEFLEDGGLEALLADIEVLYLTNPDALGELSLHAKRLIKQTSEVLGEDAEG